MIKIKIKNVEQIVKNERNWFISKIAPYFVDMEKKVEEAIVKQIREVFRTKKIKASISIVNEEYEKKKKPVNGNNRNKPKNLIKVREVKTTKPKHPPSS